MTDKQKVQLINTIITQAYEWQPKNAEQIGAFFEGVMSSIFAVLITKEYEKE